MSERKYPDLWVDPQDDPRATEANAVGERATLLGYLNHYRLTLRMKREDLDAEQLATRSVPPCGLRAPLDDTPAPVLWVARLLTLALVAIVVMLVRAEKRERVVH